ncbi:MAG: PLDc N-terminal domain-containing protein [Microbacteriaceae bacterium]|jgi:hypothetical protein|nr:PLDc N-terminal domain-containing protein [Microbacteriaceae bacterium]MCI1206864.1 PLDc N-terminal domain-containing protein [Microbacteriaceae bacterium]
MARLLVVLAFVLILLAVAALVDVLSSRPGVARVLPRWGWALLVVLVPLVGPLLWWFLGHPWGSGAGREPVVPGQTSSAPSPEPPEAFLAGLSADERIRRLEEALARLDEEPAAGSDGKGPDASADGGRSDRDGPDPGQGGDRG